MLRAAVLGDRSEFRGDLRRYYQENGWLHLVTVSGLHLSFIAMGFYRRLRRRGVSMVLSVLLASVLMAAYGYMTDLGDSMLRAMGMMGLTLGAELSGRKTDLMTSLVFTGAVMVFLRPGVCCRPDFSFLLALSAAWLLENGSGRLCKTGRTYRESK